MTWLPYRQAQRRRAELDFSPASIAVPEAIGRSALRDFPLADIARYIDDLSSDGQELLQALIDERMLAASGVYGLWPAASSGDAIVLFTDDTRGQELARFPMLRQQQVSDADAPCLSLADFVAPLDSDARDYVGAFAVTAGMEVEELAQRFEIHGDDHNASMIRALAERVTEAFAERLHLEVRRQWGYGLTENVSHADVLAKRFRGIRPAFGGAACPDHSEQRRACSMLNAKAVGIELAQSGAMVPVASISGLYFAHPKARYFSLGALQRDQVEAYAAAKRMPLAEVERWLGPSLAYQPDAHGEPTR